MEAKPEDQDALSHIQAAIAMLEADRALQIVGRALSPDEIARIDRANAALPHLTAAADALASPSGAPG